MESFNIVCIGVFVTSFTMLEHVAKDPYFITINSSITSSEESKLIILPGRFIYLARNWTSDSSRLDKMLDYFSRWFRSLVIFCLDGVVEDDNNDDSDDDSDDKSDVEKR